MLKKKTKNPLPSDTFQVSQDFCTALHFGVAADHKSTLSAEVKCGPRKKADVTHILVKQSALCVVASARPGVPKQSVAGSLLMLPSKLKRHLSSSVENLGFNRAVDLNRDYLLNRMKPSATYCNATTPDDQKCFDLATQSKEELMTCHVKCHVTVITT